MSKMLDIPVETLQSQLAGFPDRARWMEMPPKDPLVYRLYEIVQNYGYAYKAVLNEKFGDGIMSAISFSTKVEKEVDDKGEWAKITLRGKWYDGLCCIDASLIWFQATILAILDVTCSLLPVAKNKSSSLALLTYNVIEAMVLVVLA